eukprot:scaffold180348_cov14-Tisochrysis_lutea.AAC.1
MPGADWPQGRQRHTMPNPGRPEQAVSNSPQAVCCFVRPSTLPFALNQSCIFPVQCILHLPSDQMVS